MAEQNQEPYSRRAAACQELENSVRAKTVEAEGTIEEPARRQLRLRISAVEASNGRGSWEEVEEIAGAR